MRDISERKRLEEDLNRRHQDLAEEYRRKDEFLATLAHELRNPLAPLRNALHILKLCGEDRDASEQARALMERQLGQMVRLIDDLMDLSRITRGKLELRPGRVTLAEVVQAAVETSLPLLESRRHRLSVDLPAEPVELEADPARLAQVFANLLNNAAKYTRPGGAIRVLAGREGGDVVVRVRDNGVGIRPDLLERVFEPFTQVDGAREQAEGGLGIGLTLVKRLVEMHGGSVAAHSEGEGRGSEFIVRIPVASAGASPLANGPADEPAGAAGCPAARPLRVLVVDDNRDAADTLGLLLRAAGHEVRLAYHGHEVLGTAGGFRPEAMVLDIGLPGMSGYEVAREVRRQDWGRSALLVALTGWGQEADRLRSKEAGFDHHFVKPVDVEVLQRLLAGHLDAQPG